MGCARDTVGAVGAVGERRSFQVLNGAVASIRRVTRQCGCREHVAILPKMSSDAGQ